MNDALEPHSSRYELRERRRELAKEERHRIRTTRTHRIPLPIDRMADLFAAMARRNEDFRYRVTGDDSIRAWSAGWVLPQFGPPVDFRFAAQDDGATLVTATVPEVAYVLGNGHLLGVGILLKLIDEEVERWQNGQPS